MQGGIKAKWRAESRAEPRVDRGRTESRLEGRVEGGIEGAMEGTMEGGKRRPQAIETRCRLISPTTSSRRQDPSGMLFQSDRLNLSESGFFSRRAWF
jgi:hypothetical protein